jgi:hypothetical protein
MHSNVLRLEDGGKVLRELDPPAIFSKRSFVPVAANNDRVYMFGGYEEQLPSNVLGDVWSVDASGMDWKLHAASCEWEPREAQGAVYHNGRFVMFGGVTYLRPDRSSTLGAKNPSHLRTFGGVWDSLDGVEWRQLTAMAPWGPRRSFSYASFAGYIWVFGGVNDEKAALFNDVWRSIDGVEWEQVTPNAGWSPRMLSNHAPVYDDALWVIGGDNLRAPPGSDWHKSRISSGLNDVWKSTDGRNWTNVLANAPFHGRTGAYVFVLTDGTTSKLAVFGGHDDVMRMGLRTRLWFDDLWITEDGKTWDRQQYRLIRS